MDTTSGADKPIFVVQQHHATHMHWDFRLEMDGVLVSWAIPKGPSLDPGVRRLAMQVEDHAYGYKDFEGVIGEGQYGAGKVIIWDEGVYEPVNPPAAGASKNTGEKWLDRGRLEFILHGNKLRGLFAMYKTTAGKFGDNAWLLVKKKDRFATAGEIVKEQPESVRSGKTVEEVSKEDGCIGCDIFFDAGDI